MSIAPKQDPAIGQSELESDSLSDEQLEQVAGGLPTIDEQPSRDLGDSTADVPDQSPY